MLKEYIKKGFVVNTELLKNGPKLIKTTIEFCKNVLNKFHFLE